jgi:hypothetical protein
LANVPEALENKDKLPANSKLVLIPGGNQSQFGYLGTRFMNSSATINLEQQQSIVLQNIVSFLNEIDTGDIDQSY